MKSHPIPPITHTIGVSPSELSLCAPCRNRTCNLMIKSQIGRVWLTIKSAVEWHLRRIGLSKGSATAEPKKARRFHDYSHGNSQGSPRDLIYAPRADGFPSNAFLAWRVLG